MERLNMTSYREKFQQLLRELFQFDCADLDFGIYRIMNYKRDVIEKFITQDLPKAIADELDRDALADQAQAAKELKEVSEQITQTLGQRRPRRRRQSGRDLPRHAAGHEIPEPEGQGRRWSRPRSPRSEHLQPPAHLLQPLLPGRRLHLEAPLLQAPEVRHPLQRRGSLPVLGQ